MYRDHVVGVVVPAHDEADHVGEVIDTVPEFVDRVYAVDDCSTDGTWEVIRERATRTDTDAAPGDPADRPGSDAGDATDPDPAPRADGGDAAPDGRGAVVGIRHGSNRGVGGAVKTGYRRALADGVDVVAVMNGDGQMDPAVLDRLLDPVVEGVAGYAKGDRLTHPDARGEMSRWRRFGNALLTLLTKASSGYWKTNDPQNGYTAVSAATLEQLPLEELYDDYGFLNDLLTRLNVRDVRVANVPHSAQYGEEESGIAYSSFVPKLSALLLWNFLRRLTVKHLVRDFHALVFCYLLGVVGLLAGLVAVAGLAGPWAGGGLAAAVGVALLFLLSGLSLSLAVAFDVHLNEHLETTVER